jgi:hypothetical protein
MPFVDLVRQLAPVVLEALGTKCALILLLIGPQFSRDLGFQMIIQFAGLFPV